MISNEFLSLIKRCQKQDEDALEEMFIQNAGLVWSMVHRFRYTKQDPEDLYQIGCIGLMKAIKNFNPEYQVMFSTYAVPMILGEIKKFFREDGDLRISRSIKERYLMIVKYKELYIQEHEKEPQIQDIVKALEMDESDVIMALEANQYLVSLDEPYALKDGSSIRLEERIESKEKDVVANVSLISEVNKFNDIEQKLLYYRYHLAMNQQTIAELLGISQVQVSRLEKKVLLKLKDNLTR